MGKNNCTLLLKFLKIFHTTLNVQTFADFVDFSPIREKFWIAWSAKVYVREMFQNRPSAKVNVDEKFQKQGISSKFDHEKKNNEKKIEISF